MTENSFDKEDIFMLLEAYKNHIDSNRTLMEHHGKLLDQHNIIIEKQKCIMDSIDSIITKISSFNESVKDRLVDSRAECLEEHNNIKTKLYVAYIGTATIIISLVTLLYSSYQRSIISEEILKTIKLIAKHFGIGE